MLTYTAATRRLIAYAAELGLRPEVKETYRGAVHVWLNAPGADGGHGRIEIGATSGRVLRLYLRHGNDDPRPDRLCKATGYRCAWVRLDEYRAYARAWGILPRPTVEPEPERPPVAVTSGRCVWGQLPAPA